MAVTVGTQPRVLPALTEHIDVWTVLVVEQRSVPVVVTWLLVLVVELLEEIELVVPADELVEDAGLALEVD